MEDYDDIISEHSYNEEACYSDQVDTDIETELYGLVHHDSQENSIFLQDKSGSVESKSGNSEDKSDITENNSVILQESLHSNDNTALLRINSVTSKDTVNSKKKKKNTVKKNSKNNSSVRNTCTDFFCSDAIVNDNLYTSFESSAQKQNNNNNLVQSINLGGKVASSPAKRKSDVVSEILVSLQLKKNTNSALITPENSVRKKKKNSHDNNPIISEENTFVEVIDDSSDSDSSIILLEPDQSNLTTNIAKETVVLTSDSEDSDSSMEKNLSQACKRTQATVSNEDAAPNNKDLWHINYEDRFRTKKQSNRYHENAVVTCSNCQLKGHSAKFCSVPKDMKCFFCGGYHAGINCQNKICSKCFQRGHDRRRCYIRYIKTCDLCRMRGHSERNCPDLWRRYHLTTSKGSIVKGNPISHSPLFCYNCGAKGHYGGECMETRADRWSFPTWTSVVSYRNPISVLRNIKERDFQERSDFESAPLFRRERRNETFSRDTPIQNRKRKKYKSPKTPSTTNNQSTTRPTNIVQNEVYFPRTPKTANSSTARQSKSKYKKAKRKEEQSLKRQVMHRIGLQQRLGLPISSTI